jgi:ABC-type nitrate/sulfonate/bicarbonate transport system ATPase subunit
MERIAAFLERESEQSLAGISCAFEDAASEIILQASAASFCVGGGSNNKQASSFTIEGINLTARAGEVICIVGAVAAGKSTLLDGLQGFAEQIEGPPVTLNGSVAFAAQTPFILNATVKENIFFGRTPDSKRYAAALEAAQLSRDLELLPAGDETEIGEKGVNLSGGQKARVALARCIYGFRGVGGDEKSTSSSSIALLDDPLGALDASTALKVFDALFGCENKANEHATTGALRGGATLLVTHATHFLPRPEVSQIIVLKSKGFHENQKDDDSTHVGRGGVGQVFFKGTWAELLVAARAENKVNDSKTPLSDLIASAVAPHSKIEEDEAVDVKTNSATPLNPAETMKQGALITTEQV